MISCDPQDLAAAVAVAHRANDSRPSTPHHAQTVIDWDTSEVTVWATGERSTNGRTLRAETDRKGTIAVNGSLLDRICRTLGEPTVTLTPEDARLIVQQGRSRWELPAYGEPITQPTAPTSNNGGIISTSWFTDTLKKAQKIADGGGAKSGVVLFSRDGRPSIVGLSHHAVEVHHSTFGEFDGTCDVSGHLALPYTDEMLTVRYDGNKVTVHDDEVWTIATRDRVAASIPVDTVMQFLDKPLPYKVTVDPDELLAAIGQVSATVDPTASGLVPIEIRFAPGELTVLSTDAESAIACKTDDEGRAKFSADLLRRLVTDAGSGELQIRADSHTEARITTTIFSGQVAGIKA